MLPISLNMAEVITMPPPGVDRFQVRKPIPPVRLDALSREIVELKRSPDGHVQAMLRHGKQPLEVSRRCVAGLRDTLKHL